MMGGYDGSFPQLGLYASYIRNEVELDNYLNNLDDLLSYLQELTR